MPTVFDQYIIRIILIFANISLQKCFPKELHSEKKYGTLLPYMQEESKNTPDTDPSGLFSTYKTHPIENEGENMHNQDDKPSPPIQNSQKGDKNKDGALRIIIDGCVRITQTAVWSIAVFGGLFIAALATNTMDRAVSIINANI